MISWKRAPLGAILGLAIASCVPSAAAAAACPNEAFRVGTSAGLSNCRAYELVSPPDTDGRMLKVPIVTGISRQPLDMFPFDLSSSAQDSFVYEVFAGALPTPSGGSGVFDVYRADRAAAGWATDQLLSRTSTSPIFTITIPGGVSADQGYAFSNERGTDYLRSPDGSFELTGMGSLSDEPSVQGRYISENGNHVIFTTGKAAEQNGWCSDTECEVKPLEPDSPPKGTGAVYDRGADGPTHVVSLLPGNEIPLAHEEAYYQGSSKDASSVAFVIGGTLYVRIHNGISSDEETLKVAEGSPVFGGVSAEGRYVFYVVGGHSGTIHRFDTTTNADAEANPVGAGKIVNVSADGSHVYFISEEQLDGSEGTAGRPNMYVWSGGAPKFIATVLPSDLVKTSGNQSNLPALTTWTTWVTNPNPGGEGTMPGPGADSSRSTPDGSVLVFESRAQLTAYDNDEHSEIYRYDESAAAPKLTCVSCSPRVEPAVADSRLQELQLVKNWIVVNNLSDDGNRVFFESDEALVARDVNGANDVYEWEAGSSPQLISSGEAPVYPQWAGWRPYNPLPNILLSVTHDGSDVFFTAQQPLVPGAGENGTDGIYDARIGGGFPLPVAEEPCAEEGCKPAAAGSIPPSAGAGSETTVGAQNVKPRKHRCTRKGKKSSNTHKRNCPKKKKKKGARTSSVTEADGTGERTTEAVPQLASPTSSQTAEAPFDAQSSLAPVTSVGTVDEFGIERLQATLTSPQAGAHADFNTNVEFNHYEVKGEEEASAAAEEVTITLPPGLLGNPAAVPTCSMGDFSSFGKCPYASQVGVMKVRVGLPLNSFVLEPVFNIGLPHPEQEIARLGVVAHSFPVFIDVKLRTAGDYGVTATIHDPPGLGVLIRARTTLWGDPSGAQHDNERFLPSEAYAPTPHPSGISAADRKGFMSNPTACQAGSVEVSATSYQLPGQVFSAAAPLAPIVGCTGLPFAPSFSADPTSHVAGAVTGLRTKLLIPQHLGPEEPTTAPMREARVTLPEGMQVAAGAANWIGTCSEEQVGYHKEVDTACPDNAKLGTAAIISPALSVPIEGTIYQRSPEPGHQLGLWLTADTLGLHVKLPGELEPDKQTGRLTAVFRDLPQVPVEEIDLDVWGGPRAPLQNPDHCGSFTTDFSFSPHSDDSAVTGQSQMQITEGCNQGFSPVLKAGVAEPTAGKFSPFVFDLTRPDGDQALRGFELKLPDGELAKLKGVPLCGDADASAGTCPQGTRIGSLQATTGPGPEPFTLPEPGKPQPQIYLAGPFKEAPFSIVSEVPAQAGPFDLGTLAVRSGLDVEPESGRAVVKADPLPQFFEGIGIAYRHLHAVIDRPEFNLNPTDCQEMAVTADVTSTQGAVAHPQARFQVDGCKALKFKPKLSLKLQGGTRRASYPALTAVLKARKGDANIASTSVALPHSEFLAQEHIGTICTRVQFAADNCPKGSVYGKAKAVTPLLDNALSGPVYLRSSNHPLPDLVAKLGGQLEIDLVGRIDSKNGGIRTTFEAVPDAPVTKFVLQMRGGKKGLLTNSTDICRGSHKATVRMKAQNGRVADLRPTLVSSGCGKKKLGKHKHRHG